MRNKFSIFIFLWITNTLMASAQHVRLVESTEMSWSGGIAGRYGVNYGFTVEFTHYKNEPMPDTIWLKNTPYPLVQGGNGTHGSGYIKKTIGKKSVEYYISVGISHDDYRERILAPPGGGKEKEQGKPLPQPPMNYKGVALLSYTYKGERHYFEITGITKKMPPVNYP